MLERKPVVGDFLMWPNNDELLLKFVYAVRGVDDLFVADVKTMEKDILPRSITYVTTGNDPAMTGGPFERARERAKKIRFATRDEIDAGLLESAEYLNEEHAILARKDESFTTRLAELEALRSTVAATTDA